MNQIKHPLRILAVAALALAPAAAPLTTPALAQSAAPAGDMALAVAALRSISTMQAAFTQTDRNGRQLSGTLTLKRPGKIRFQYQPGIPFLIVSDGTALTFIDYEVRQVQRWPIRNSPLGALLDPNRDIARYGTLQPTNDANVISIEVRDRGHPEFGVMTMVFVRQPAAPGGLQLASWVALDSQNQRTTVRLSNHRYGQAVADSTFRYNDPRQSGPRSR